MVSGREAGMHIVYLTTEFTIDNFHCGGLANYVANMADIFAENGHKITILVVDWKGGLKSEVQWKKNIWVDTLSLDNIVSGASDAFFKNAEDSKMHYEIVGFSNNIIIEKKLLELNRRRKIDVVQYSSELLLHEARSRFFPSLVRVCAFLYLFRLAYRPVFDFEKAVNEMNQRDKIQISSLKRSFAAIAPSEMTGNLLEKFTGRKVTILESPFYKSSEEWDDTLYNHTLKGKRYILFFGSLGYLKGTHIIGEIIYDILSKYPDILMVFAGVVRKADGSIDNRKAMVTLLKQKAKEFADRVIYLGEVNKPSLFPIIHHTELCLLPSRIDNLPNTCIEAMGLGKIVIGTDGASFEQLITDGYNGFLGKREDSHSFFQAIEKALALTEDEREELGNRAKARIEEMNPEYVYRRFLNYYNKVIEGFHK